MADEIDAANEQVEKADARGIAIARAAAAAIPVGKKGYCVECGIHSMRLVNRWCAPCRDHFNKTHSREHHK